MIGKWRREQLLGAAAYDDLTPGERASLEKRTARDPALAEEVDALRAFTRALPNEPPLFEGNLLPAVKAQIAAEQAGAPARLVFGRLLGYGLASACVLGVFGALLMQTALPTGGNPGQPVIAENGINSVLSGVLSEAGALRAQGDAAGAYTLLAESLTAHPEDPLAAEAQLALATVAFEDLQWYSEAEQAYTAFARNYTTAYLMHPGSTEIAFRRNLLEEARAMGYEPLYALNDAGASVGRLERILARHPEGFIASQAAEQMMAAVPGARNDIEALELARAQCSDPVALAHLDIELAERYALDLGDGLRARALLEEVAARPGAHYAGVATERLLRLTASD